ncbi:CD1107 family mobile element protein [Dysosmobacter welbionis]
MKNKAIRMFTATLAAVLCMAAFSVTAYAGGVDPEPEPLPETTEAPLPEETEEPTTGGIEMEPEGVPVTPKGNAALVDDFFGDKQLITVTTKAGNYFYILIDRANEDKETSVHFLNQVDDADLQALLEDGEAEPEVCTCAEKCEDGAVNTACPVCKNNLTACVGAAPEAEEPAETAEPEEEAGNRMGGLVVFLVVLLIGGGAALYFFKFKKPKADTKGNDDLDEYDFGEDEDEPAPEVDDDTGEIQPKPLDDYLLDDDEPKKENEE